MSKHKNPEKFPKPVTAGPIRLNPPNDSWNTYFKDMHKSEKYNAGLLLASLGMLDRLEKESIEELNECIENGKQKDIVHRFVGRYSGHALSTMENAMMGMFASIQEIEYIRENRKDGEKDELSDVIDAIVDASNKRIIEVKAKLSEALKALNKEDEGS